RVRPSASIVMIKKILTPLASLRLTVVMFVLAIALVFMGTLAQVDEGIFTVLTRYFRTGIAWIPFQALVRFGQVFLGVSPDAQVSGSFPFPGGWLIGGVLLVNLLAAHAVRFDVEVMRYLANSEVTRKPPPGTENLATAGDGLKEVAIEKPEVSGTDQEQMDDLPSVYVTFWKKGTNESLGTYLLWKLWSIWW